MPKVLIAHEYQTLIIFYVQIKTLITLNNPVFRHRDQRSHQYIINLLLVYIFFYTKKKKKKDLHQFTRNLFDKKYIAQNFKTEAGPCKARSLATYSRFG